MYGHAVRPRLIWRQPPPGSRPRINWRHPLTRDLIFAVLPSAGCYDLTDYIAPTHVGGNKFIGENRSVALLCETASNNFTHWGSPTKFDLTQASSFSTFSVFTAYAGAGAARMFPQTRDTGSGNRTLFQWNLTTGNNLRIVFGSTLADLGFTDSTTAFTDSPGVIRTGAGVRDVAADQIRVYADGILESEITDPSTGTWTLAGTVGSALISNPASTGSFGSLMSHHLDLMWSRAITSEEVGLLNQDPYVFFDYDELDILTSNETDTAPPANAATSAHNRNLVAAIRRRRRYYRR